MISPNTSTQTNAERYLGQKKVFLNDEGTEVQGLIQQGYKRCSRRVYFIRLMPKQPTTSSARPQKTGKEQSEHFIQTGEIDLQQTSAKNLLVNLNTLREYVKTTWPDKGMASPTGGFVRMDVGLSYSGLEKLGIHTDLLDTFRKKSPAFYDNALMRAQKELGDTGYSDPQQWEKIYRREGGKGFDIALFVHWAADVCESVCNEKADTPSSTFNFCNDPLVNQKLLLCFENQMLWHLFCPKVNQQASICFGGQSQAMTAKDWIEDAQPKDFEGGIYFGYKDGLTSPLYEQDGHLKKVYGDRKTHALGEILLGHPRNDGENLYADLRLTHKASPYTAPSYVPREDSLKTFFKNSSFGVMRRMQQREKAFDEWLEKQARQMVSGDQDWGVTPQQAGTYELTKDWIKAKILGRTASKGILLTPAVTAKNLRSVEEAQTGKPDTSQEPGFHDHANADPQGEACPFASHIRRMNPRDDAVTPFIHRPILRRGMPYAKNSPLNDEEHEHGLSGLFFCADIVEQFEHLVGKWANYRVLGRNDASTVKDPLIGNHDAKSQTAGRSQPSKSGDEFFLNSKADRGSKNLLSGFDRPFVVTRGCAYLWFPSTLTLTNLQQYIKP
jgi:deferrochelatase/peroxidase EfeB